MNMLVRLTLQINLPEEVVENLVGRPDDGSDEYDEEAAERVEEAVRDEPSRFLEYVTGEEVDIDA